MLEAVVLLLFCGALMICVVLDVSILYALVLGLALFMGYGRKKGHDWGTLTRMALSGVKTIKGIIIVFCLIGLLTALWRACGTIPTILVYALKLVNPSIFLLMVFLLNCGVSVLTGTAFGSAATMGVVCLTMAPAMGVDPVLAGGAMLGGVFFGDRCSPVSTSALLVSQLTKTDLFDNIRVMVRRAMVPFLVSCALYLVLGLGSGGTAAADLEALFSRSFRLHWLALLPAAATLILPMFRINVKKTMLVSILLALGLCFGLQGIAPADIPALLLLGYKNADPETAALLNGGGLQSMLKVGCIVSLSSSYAGLFEGTGLLKGAKHAVATLSGKIGVYAATVGTSVLASMVACNQTLAIMLTHQLVDGLEPDSTTAAMHLEDSAVVLAPMIPWSIAFMTPVSSAGAPTNCLWAAFFLYLLPVWQLLLAAKERRRAAV